MTLPEPTLYYIKPNKTIPNSPKPILHYKGAFLKDGKVDIASAYDGFRNNGWEIHWVTRYGRTQGIHYHSASHEAMVVVSGPGKICWGRADLTDDGKNHKSGDVYDGLDMDVDIGDLFVIPAGVAHKNYNPQAVDREFGCLTGDARGIESDDPRKMVAELPLTGFMMMGAYPVGYSWDWGEGGDHLGQFEQIWDTKNPDRDPFVGDNGGTNKYWTGHQESKSKL